jgi:phosphoribosylamine--glycine ligase
VLEEFIKGEEFSYFVIVDKNSYKFFGTAQDHKRVGANDTGPNTGGMGAFSPAVLFNSILEKKINHKIIEPTINAMKKLGHPYQGFLYAGLMIKDDEPYLIEYNIRMGDPECQVIMMSLETDLVKIFDYATQSKIDSLKIKLSKKKSITFVLCSNGYPFSHVQDKEIKNLSNLKLSKDIQIFHAATYEKNNKIYSNGGRVLNVTSSAKNIDEARKKSLACLKKINWTDGFYREDIGWKAIQNK